MIFKGYLRASQSDHSPSFSWPASWGSMCQLSPLVIRNIKGLLANKICGKNRDCIVWEPSDWAIRYLQWSLSYPIGAPEWKLSLLRWTWAVNIWRQLADHTPQSWAMILSFFSFSLSSFFFSFFFGQKEGICLLKARYYPGTWFFVWFLAPNSVPGRVKKKNQSYYLLWVRCPVNHLLVTGLHLSEIGVTTPFYTWRH